MPLARWAFRLRQRWPQPRAWDCRNRHLEPSRRSWYGWLIWLSCLCGNGEACACYGALAGNGRAAAPAARRGDLRPRGAPPKLRAMAEAGRGACPYRKRSRKRDAQAQSTLKRKPPTGSARDDAENGRECLAATLAGRSRSPSADPSPQKGEAGRWRATQVRGIAGRCRRDRARLFF